jgi:sodium/bile acid cotransporter 7
MLKAYELLTSTCTPSPEHFVLRSGSCSSRLAYLVRFDIVSCFDSVQVFSQPLRMLRLPNVSANSEAMNVDASAGPPQRPARCQLQVMASAVQRFVIDNYLPLAFLVALVIALSFPLPGRAVASWHVGDVRIVQAINNFSVFLVSGLTLRTREVKKAFKQWLCLLYGMLAILAFTPCLGFGAKHLGLVPAEFNVGLAIFCVVPTTLGVGVALTAVAKGNQALALLLTVATNLLGIVTVPYELKLILLGSSVVSVDPGNLVVKLILTVLVPSVIGKALCSTCKPIKAAVRRHNVVLSLFSHTNLALIIWQTLSGAQSVLLAQRFSSIVLVIVAGVTMHMIYLVFNAIVVCACRVPVQEAIAVLIMASQKSAPVAVTIISYITTDVAQQGLFSIPAIVGQLAQIFMGAVLVRYLSKLVKEDAD